MISRMNRLPVLLLAGVLLVCTVFCAHADTSIFVGTDRHAKYETETVGGDKPERIESGPPRQGRAVPVFDDDGNYIWHNNLTPLLKAVAQDTEAVQPDVVLLGGDNVGDAADRSVDNTGYPMGAPYYSLSGVSAQIRKVLGDEVRCLYTYGSHDDHAVETYDAVFFSGPMQADGYYIYGISYSQMINDTDSQSADRKDAGKDAADPYGHCAQTASHRFLSWVSTLEDHLPIVVMSHVPLHASRADNAGAWTWTRALNHAAENHDIIFLWGHNHTVEEAGSHKAAEREKYLRLPGEELTVQSWDVDPNGKTLLRRGEGRQAEPIGQTETLRFIYMNAGYITDGVGTLLTFSDSDGNGLYDRLTARRYALSPEDEAFGDTGKVSPFEYTLREWE